MMLYRTANNLLSRMAHELESKTNTELLRRVQLVNQGRMDASQLNASQLRKLKNGLEKQLEKYKMKSVVQALQFEKGPRENCGTLNGSKIAPGGASLRQLIIQTEGLVQLLQEYRPSIARQYATQLAEYVTSHLDAPPP